MTFIQTKINLSFQNAPQFQYSEFVWKTEMTMRKKSVEPNARINETRRDRNARCTEIKDHRRFTRITLCRRPSISAENYSPMIEAHACCLETVTQLCPQSGAWHDRSDPRGTSGSKSDDHNSSGDSFCFLVLFILVQFGSHRPAVYEVFLNPAEKISPELTPENIF